MNKLLIPVILTIVVVISGVFAFMPVEKSSTVHAEILAASSGLQVDTFDASTFDLGATDFIVVTGTDPFCMLDLTITIVNIEDIDRIISQQWYVDGEVLRDDDGGGFVFTISDFIAIDHTIDLLALGLEADVGARHLPICVDETFVVELRETGGVVDAGELGDVVAFATVDNGGTIEVTIETDLP